MSINPAKPLAVHSDTSIWRRLEFTFRGRRFGLSVLDRYVFREIFIPFSMWLIFFTVLFMSMVLKDVIGELLGKGIGLGSLLQYLGYLTLEKLTQTIPLACLMSGIMAAGRLSGDSEITAMRASGISYPRIYVIYIVFGFFAMILVAYVNLHVGPMNARERENFEDELKTYHSLSLVKPGRWLGRANIDALSKTGNDIYAEKKIGRILHRVQIREWYTNLNLKKSATVTLKGRSIPIGDGFIYQIVHAKTGEIINRISPEGKTEKVIRLRGGFIIELDDKRTRYEVTNFRKGYMDYAIPKSNKSIGRLNVRPDNYTFIELLEFLDRVNKGGNVINVCALNPECEGGGEARAGGSKLGENIPGGSGTFVLPSRSKMKEMEFQLGTWVTLNGSKVGKPGGPTSTEYQQKFRLYVMIKEFGRDADKTTRKFEVEVHKRLAMPVACLLFFFVSFPLGLTVKRSGKGMSFALAGFVFLVYMVSMNWGLSQAYSGRLQPWAGAWIPDLVIALMGFYIMSRRTDDFSPFRFLTRPFRFISRLAQERVLRPLEPVFRPVRDVVQRILRPLSAAVQSVRTFLSEHPATRRALSFLVSRRDAALKLAAKFKKPI